jgi:F-type H+-transporting ATPase subunit epsilon
VGEQGGPADATRRLFVDGGFVEVAHDAVTVITQRAIPAEKLDAQSARADLERITASKATGDEAIDARLQAEQSARALVRTATRGR